MDNTRQHWAVLGGGMLGMTLALGLVRRGYKVTLCEAADHCGGLADAWQLGDVVWDRHYHVTLLSDTANRDLLAELGLESEMHWVTARTGFYGGGRIHSLSTSLDYLRFPLLNFVDKLRLAVTILYASRVKDGRKLEKIGVDRWLTAWSGRRTFEKIWRPLLRSKLGDNYKRASAAFIWATIRRLYAARRQGMKQEMFGYVPGGYARILNRFEHLLREEGVSVRLRSAVERVEPGAHGTARVSFQDGARESFDSVVMTMPGPVASSLCPALSPDETKRLNGIDYQGIVCASLLLKKPLGSYYVTNITDDGLPFTGVIEMTTLVDRAQFGGHSLVYLPKYVAPDDPYFELTDEEIKERFVSGLSRMYPAFRAEDIVQFRISRVRRVFAVPTLDYSARLPPIRTSVPGVYILNSAHIVNGTLNVDETVRLVDRYMDLFQPRPMADGEESAGEPSYEAVCQPFAGSGQ